MEVVTKARISDEAFEVMSSTPMAFVHDLDCAGHYRRVLRYCGCRRDGSDDHSSQTP